MSASDLGIVLFARGDGTGAYTKPDGSAGTIRTLTEQHFIASDWFEAGRLAQLFITISGSISAQMASAVVLLERRRRDAQNGALFGPAVIATLRADDLGAAAAAQQTITRAQLAGQNVSGWPNVAPAVEALDVVLLATAHAWAGPCRVLVKATNAPQPTDQLIVAVNGA